MWNYIGDPVRQIGKMSGLSPGTTGLPHYKCIKTSLTSIVKDERVVREISQIAANCNKIVMHSLQLLKLYFLHLYDADRPFPTIDKQFTNALLKTVCATPTTGRKPSAATASIKNDLKAFYNAHYQSLQPETLKYTHLNTVLDYLAIDVVTLYENNIKQRFVGYVERFVDVVWQKKALVRLMRKKFRTPRTRQVVVSKLCRQLRLIKNDILGGGTEKSSSPIYHAWIDSVRTTILPQKVFQKDSIYYDLQCTPQDYLRSMVAMMKVVEKYGEGLSNVFPLRSSVAPKHVRIDTTSLIHLFLTKAQGSKTFYLTKGNLVKYQDRLWRFFFRLDKKCFHVEDAYKYRFHYMIETDGVSCSIILLREDLVGKRLRAQPSTPRDEKYIDDLSVEERTGLLDKKVVAIDPNMSDLIYCIDDVDKTFRYTQNQRRKETKAKKYRDILQQSKKSTRVSGKTVAQWEAELSHVNKKTLRFDDFKKYIEAKNRISQTLSSFYEERIHRKLKLSGFINRRRSEQRMLTRFQKMFGSPDEVVIGFGDFEQAKHRKYHEPVKGRGFRTLFRKAGYPVYLVDEFRTSCRCSACEGETSTFRECVNPRPWRRAAQPVVLRHGLVKCKTCARLWNRDTNASRNIRKIMTNELSGLSRPEYLSRARGSLSDATSASA